MIDSTCLLTPAPAPAPVTPAAGPSYCHRCDAFLGIEDVHPIACHRDGRGLVVTVETPTDLDGCRTCGLVAHGHGRQIRTLHDIPAFGAPVRLRWRRRRWICPDPRCMGGTFAENAPHLVEGGAKLTIRAVWWAISQIRYEYARHRRPRPPARSRLAHPVVPRGT